MDLIQTVEARDAGFLEGNLLDFAYELAVHLRGGGSAVEGVENGSYLVLAEYHLRERRELGRARKQEHVRVDLAHLTDFLDQCELLHYRIDLAFDFLVLRDGPRSCRLGAAGSGKQNCAEEQ